MNLKQFIKKGYFPKELPPPFNTKDYAKKSSLIYNKIKKQEAHWHSSPNLKVGEFRERNYFSDVLNYKIPKGKFTRRGIKIVNPCSYLLLSKSIIDNFSSIKSALKLSTVSQSKPTERKSTKRALSTYSISLNDFRERLINESYDKRVQLRVDITQFYPSIYTHSIPWSFLGKKKSKAFFELKSRSRAQFNNLISQDNFEAKLYNAADLIDTQVRNCQNRQSIGLPIGPDSSFLLAEVIASRIDNNIINNNKNIDFTFLRYYDDYYFFLDNIGDAEILLKKVQKEIELFNLETNGDKISIEEGPFHFDNEWAIKFNEFEIKSVRQLDKLKSYFSLLFETIKIYPKDSDWVINYSLKRFELGRTIIEKKNWKMFEALLLRIILIDSRIIDQVLNILISYVTYLDKKSKNRIINIFQKIIVNHIDLNHNFEVSWCLWGFIALRIDCPSDILRKVLATNDDVSKVIALDIINKKLYSGRKPGLSQLKKELDSHELMGSNWLFNYVSVQKGWLIPKDPNYKTNIEFMELLFHYDISFYDETTLPDPTFMISTQSYSVNQNNDTSNTDDTEINSFPWEETEIEEMMKKLRLDLNRNKQVKKLVRLYSKEEDDNDDDSDDEDYEDFDDYPDDDNDFQLSINWDDLEDV